MIFLQFLSLKIFRVSYFLKVLKHKYIQSMYYILHKEAESVSLDLFWSCKNSDTF